MYYAFDTVTWRQKDFVSLMGLLFLQSREVSQILMHINSNVNTQKVHSKKKKNTDAIQL